ncbi:hypothetical protein ACO0LC_27515 [Undibacterium sp. JH2W]|uniref:hypothetical protein n=1 Tax=Undibacterium sp. JH2W TaxID=3413037 RepID=UPI003BF36FD3
MAIKVKTTLKRLFILLVAASNLLISAPEAQALEQKFDLELRVLNATKHVIEICHATPTDCRAIVPEDTYEDGQITNGKQVPNFYRWLYRVTINICGKNVRLSRTITNPEQQNNGRDIIFYRMTITEEAYQRVCSDEKKPTGKHP